MVPRNNIPSVSVVMSVYNSDRYLRESVESILNQTFTDFEFIIIDDGSTDDTYGILQEYSNTDNRVKVVSRENRGLVYSLNEAIDLAKGEYIARMDGDDISLPDRFEKQVAHLNQNDDVVAVGTRIVLIDECGRPLMEWNHKHSHDEIVPRLLIGDGSALTHPAVMMRKAAVIEIGGYDEIFQVSQDLDLFIKLSEIGKLENLPEVLLYWRQHSESINSSYSHLWTEKKRKAVKHAIYRRGNYNFAYDLVRMHKEIIPDNNSTVRAKKARRNRYYKTAIYYPWRLIKTMKIE